MPQARAAQLSINDDTLLPLIGEREGCEIQGLVGCQLECTLAPNNKMRQCGYRGDR